MSIASALGLSRKKIRYGFVALGDITQEAMLPAVAHTGNSTVTAFVTGDAEKARLLAERYGVKEIYDYSQFDKMLASGNVDALYIATPNWMHAEFIIPALKAGIHVLVEKPLEVSLAKCKEILAAQQVSSAKLMVAYRLHFEPGTLSAIEKIRNGTVGEAILFTSAFAQMLSPDNHRAKNGDLAGPVLDMGAYPVNAVRNLFGAEPTEVIAAVGTRHREAGFGDFDDTVSTILRFPDNRLAQFTVSYYGNSIGTYTVVGTKGSLEVNPAYTYGEPLEHWSKIDGTDRHESFKSTDQFGGELKYFSDCILENRDPEPDAEEGYADVRVLEGILNALKTGKPQVLEPFSRTKCIDTSAQEEKLSMPRVPEPVNAASPVR